MRWVSVKQLVREYDGAFSEQGVYTWIRRKLVRATKIGQRVLVDADHFAEIVNSNLTGPTPRPAPDGTETAQPLPEGPPRAGRHRQPKGKGLVLW